MTKVSASPEGSPFTPRQVRMLKISVAIMTALLILGIIALVYGMARQASRLGAPAQTALGPAGQSPYVQALDLGQGEIKEVVATNGLIILHWNATAIDTVLTLDARSGHEVGRIQVPHR